MTEPNNNLPIPKDVSAQLEQMKAGGLIEAQIGGPERSMDRMIDSHLGTVAMLEARGDMAPERPLYIFNPDSGLLINYALRRNQDSAKSGLFADVVELDEKGKPRHGVSVANPFATSTGFINVSIGDNRYGFAPSHIDMKLDSDDPLQTMPPNIETADLLAMLNQEPIPADESVADFTRRRQTERDEFRAKVLEQQRRHYLGTHQSFGEFTNPDMHLIIADRDEAEAALLAEASREVGLYPLLVTGDEVLDHFINVKRLLGAPDELGESIPELLRSTHPDLFKWLGTNAVSFVTIDLAAEKRSDNGSPPRDITINLPRPVWGLDDEGKIQWADQSRSVELIKFTEAILGRSPTFARLINQTWSPDIDKVIKDAHGSYTQVPVNPRNPDNLREYTDWLRKVRLDMALTLYLRGLNQLG